MRKTSQVRTHNKYIGGQVRSKLYLVFSVVFGLALVGFCVRGRVGWKDAGMNSTSPPPPPGINIGRASDIFFVISLAPPTLNVKAGGRGGQEC